MTESKKDQAGEAAHAGGAPRHAAPDGADRHPLIDLTRDPTPGVADHAAKGEADDDNK